MAARVDSHGENTADHRAVDAQPAKPAVPEGDDVQRMLAVVGPAGEVPRGRGEDVVKPGADDAEDQHPNEQAPDVFRVFAAPPGLSGCQPGCQHRAYCHCSFVHPFLDEIPSKLSPTFCYCGAGWYTRLWEGILGEPVKIEHVETLLRGNDQCTLTITLPLELSGECSPG